MPSGIAAESAGPDTRRRSRIGSDRLRSFPLWKGGGPENSERPSRRNRQRPDSVRSHFAGRCSARSDCRFVSGRKRASAENGRHSRAGVRRSRRWSRRRRRSVRNPAWSAPSANPGRRAGTVWYCRPERELKSTAFSSSPELLIRPGGILLPFPGRKQSLVLYLSGRGGANEKFRYFGKKS